MRLTLVTPPAALPVTLGDAKLHCRVVGDDEDQLIADMVDAAVSYLDGYGGVLGRCLVTQTWRADLLSLADRISLPFPDAQITEMVYTDAAAGPVAWRWHESLAMPALVPLGGMGRPASITFTAGYGGPPQVPAALRLAILRLVAFWYDNRAIGGEPEGFGDVISPFRVRRV